MEFLESNWTWIIAVVVVIALIVMLRGIFGSLALPYVRRERLVTKSELKFYWALKSCVQDDWAIFAMVRIADLIRVEKGTKNMRSWLNRILSKHIDFVLCDPSTLVPVLAIELDDASHDRPERQERDRFVNEAFASAGLPLLRIGVQATYEVKELREKIEQRSLEL